MPALQVAPRLPSEEVFVCIVYSTVCCINAVHAQAKWNSIHAMGLHLLFPTAAIHTEEKWGVPWRTRLAGGGAAEVRKGRGSPTVCGEVHSHNTGFHPLVVGY